MADPLSKILGQKLNGTRVVPMIVKITVIFTIFLLVSNFTTNYINLMLNRGEQIRLLNQLHGLQIPVCFGNGKPLRPIRKISPVIATPKLLPR